MNDQTFTRGEILDGLKILLEWYNNQTAWLIMTDGQERPTFDSVDEFLDGVRTVKFVEAQRLMAERRNKQSLLELPEPAREDRIQAALPL